MEWESLIDSDAGRGVRRLKVPGGWIYQVEILSIERFGSLSDKSIVQRSSPLFVADAETSS